MADTDPSLDPAPDFAPVPVKPRRHGWSAERQRLFIRTLAESGCVSDAATATGLSPRSAYRLRLRPDAADFRRAWDAALVLGTQRLVSVAFERAVKGSYRTIWHKGEVVGQERIPSDRLLMFLLKHYDPVRFGVLESFQADVADPRITAQAQLPDLIDRLADCDEPAAPPSMDEYGIGEPEIVTPPEFDHDPDCAPDDDETDEIEIAPPRNT